MKIRNPTNRTLNVWAYGIRYHFIPGQEYDLDKKIVDALKVEEPSLEEKK